MPRVVNATILAVLAGLLFATGPALAVTGNGDPSRARVAIIIDDLGNQRRSGLEAIRIPFIHTLAIMPGRPYSRELAEATHRTGKTVIVHAPMANHADFPLGPMGLDRSDGRDGLMRNLLEGLNSVPHAEGLSNHMGSRLTEDAEAMGWIMSALRERELFFFDSLTVASSQGWQVARDMGLSWGRRHVFLDHEPTPEFIQGQWDRALRHADKHGYVTVIGHPYPETLAFFAQLNPNDYPDYEWVSLRDLLYPPQVPVFTPAELSPFAREFWPPPQF
ncbi:MAG: divergent polysaccharide deacetylase family protein [Saccharospirillum sp.]